MPIADKLKDQLQQELGDLLQESTTPEEGAKFGEVAAVVAGLTSASENVFLGAAGQKDIKTGEKIAVDTQLTLFSCTKSMTALAALKLYEEGKLNLDIPAKEYVPFIADILLVEENSVSDKGEFTVPPRKPDHHITVRHLLLHTSGLSYLFNSDDYLKLAKKGGANAYLVANPTTNMFRTEVTPVLFEPGSKWMYGYNYDILGLVIKAISGKHLGEYLQEILFGPAGMTTTTFHIKDDSNLAKIHFRARNGDFISSKRAVVPLDPEIDMGGQGAFGTAGDYLKFLRVWLNYGLSPDTGNRILKEETVRFALHNHLKPGMTVNFQTQGAPKTTDGFTLTGNAINTRKFLTGRPAGSIYWGGLANLFYWIDFENGIAGFWGSQLLPPYDISTFQNYFRFEGSIYSAIDEWKESQEENAKL